MKRLEALNEAKKLVLDEDGNIRTATHCLEVVALLLSHVAQAEEETRKVSEKLDWSLKTW